MRRSRRKRDVMYELIFGGSILASIYYFIYRGLIFRLIMWLWGYYGLALTLDRSQTLHQAPIIAFNYPVSWAYIISFIITLAAILTTKYTNKG